MTHARVRHALAVPVVAAFGVFLAWGLSGLPHFGGFHGRYGTLMNHVALPERGATNAVTAIAREALNGRMPTIESQLRRATVISFLSLAWA